MRKYRASNRMPLASFPLLLLVGILSAVGLGLALWKISELMNFLAIIIVMIAGLILGGILSLVVKAGKVRSPLIAALVGLLAGSLLYGVYQYAGYYITFREDMRDLYAENAGKAPNDTQLDHELDLILTDEVGQGGFVGYMLLNADLGITITSSRSSSSDIDVTGTGVWVYWGLELLLVAGFAVFGAIRAARQPFDEEANAWYGKPELFAQATGKERKAVIKALKDGDFQTAGHLLTTNELKYPRTEILIRRSPNAESAYAQQDLYVSINYATRKGRSSTARSGVISPSEFKLLQTSMAQPAMPMPSSSQVSTAF